MTTEALQNEALVPRMKVLVALGSGTSAAAFLHSTAQPMSGLQGRDGLGRPGLGLVSHSPWTGITVLVSIRPLASEPSSFPCDVALGVPALFPFLKLAKSKCLQRRHSFSLGQRENPHHPGKEDSGQRVLPTLISFHIS